MTRLSLASTLECSPLDLSQINGSGTRPVEARGEMTLRGDPTAVPWRVSDDFMDMARIRASATAVTGLSHPIPSSP